MKRFFILILVLFVINAFAQAPQKFYTRFGGYGHDIGYGVIQTLNGQYAVTGSTGSFGAGNSDVYLAFVDSMGWVRWEKSYGGFNNDVGRSIIQLADSGFVIAGYTNSFGSGGYDVLVVRTDKSGNLIWQKSYGGLDWDFGYCVKTCPTGDSLIVAGSTYSYGYGKMDGYILKLDLNGNLQWQDTYGGAEDDEFKSFVLTYNNQYAFAGTTKSMGDVKGDAWLVKTGLAGDSIFSLKYGTGNKKQFFNDIKENPNNNNLHLCGGYDSLGVDSTWAMILILDPNGGYKFSFIHSYHEQNDEQYLTNAHTRGNYFYYIRKSIKSSTDHREEAMVAFFEDDLYNGATKYGSLDDDQIYCISKTKDKGFIGVGYTKGYGAELSDVFMLKMDTVSLLGSNSVIGVKELENKAESYNVYPSFTNGDVGIYSRSNSGKGYVYLSDAMGKMIIRKELDKKNTNLDLHGLSEGFYFITITENNYSKTFKVMKIE
jgi:hypothetical protein